MKRYRYQYLLSVSNPKVPHISNFDFISLTQYRTSCCILKYFPAFIFTFSFSHQMALTVPRRRSRSSRSRRTWTGTTMSTRRWWCTWWTRSRTATTGRTSTDSPRWACSGATRRCSPSCPNRYAATSSCR